MKNWKNPFLVAAALCSLLLFACKSSVQQDDALSYIPKDVTSVTAMNLKSMMDKMDFKAVQAMEFYQEAITSAQKESPALAEILRNPAKSGIDLTKNAYLIQTYGKKGGTGMFIAVAASIANNADFEAMLKTGKNVKITDKKSYKIILTSSDADTTAHNQDDDAQSSYGSNAFVAWNGKIALLGTSSNSLTDLDNYFAGKPSESFASNDKVRALMATPHDMYSVFSSDGLANTFGLYSGMAGISSEALKGNLVTSYSDFEKGQITGKSVYDFNKELRAKFGILFKDHVKTDFSKVVANNPAFIATLSLDMKGLKEILNNNPQFSAMAQGASQYGFSVDDVAKAFDGDFVVAANQTADAKDLAITVALKVNDKATASKFLNMAVQQKMLTKSGDDYSTSSNNGGIVTGQMADMKMSFVGDILVLTKSDNLGKIKAGLGANALAGDAKKIAEGGVMNAYANFEKIVNSSEDMKKTMGSLLINSMTMTLGNKSGESTLTMRDANENSLKSLMKMLNAFYLESKKDKDRPVGTKAADKVM